MISTSKCEEERFLASRSERLRQEHHGQYDRRPDSSTSGSVNAFGLELKDHYWEIMRRLARLLKLPRSILFERMGQSGIIRDSIGGIPSIKIKEVLERVNLLDAPKINTRPIHSVWNSV